ncbi:MAG: hypothetical protein DLM72_16030 [Candidatus Nitrosopolaris wilkensis]|nr:MAG: hypothetical protein DLM72_16030 [Candidatus Nitrosopolaris wilkensis]
MIEEWKTEEWKRTVALYHYPRIDTEGVIQEEDKLSKGLEGMGYVVAAESPDTLMDLDMGLCGSQVFVKKKEDGSIIRISISMSTNKCEYCHKQTTGQLNGDHYDDYMFMVCDECWHKIDTNELKLTMSNTYKYWLDPDRDNSCDRCHKILSSHTELYRPAAEGYEYVCAQRLVKTVYGQQSPKPESKRLSDKAIEYIESHLSKVCLCSHLKEDHGNGQGNCKYSDNSDELHPCEEFKPENGERLWIEASKRDKLWQW